jgi:hypothetical protein
MKSLLTIIALVLILSSCGKDRFTSEPQIEFNSIKPNTYIAGSFVSDVKGPILSIQLKDAEGDFGFSDGNDTSYVYIKNISIAPFRFDSIKFPSTLIRKSNLNAAVEVDLAIPNGLLGNSGLRPRPYTDTAFFEIYVKDFAKNKSNVIITTDPVFIRTL